MDYMGVHHHSHGAHTIYMGYTQSTWGTNAVHRGGWSILGHSTLSIEPDSLNGVEMVYMGYR